MVLLDFVNFFIMNDNPNYYSLITKIFENLNVPLDPEDTTLRGVITIIFLLLSSFFSMLTVFSSAKFFSDSSVSLIKDSILMLKDMYILKQKYS